MENQLTRSLYSAAVLTANKLTQGGKKNNNNQGKVIERKKKKKEIEVEQNKQKESWKNCSCDKRGETTALSTYSLFTELRMFMLVYSAACFSCV